MVGLNKCIDALCSKHWVAKSAFTLWKYKVISVFDDNINIMSFMNCNVYHLPITMKMCISKKKQLDTFDSMHNEFFVTPIGKAKGNVAFMFFFLLVIMKELGLSKNTASINKTYTQVNKYNSRVISHHAAFLKNEFNLESTVLTHICKLIISNCSFFRD